ncbi:uncharacterized protein LOC128394153 [Panonychus citri]|uniref:uncharacterized protein LOC128394153 n=1 Tax=Panonychus citri TaxID=50023 RepID=UPI002307D7BB|nr:uncharacterized protein LOC128394153 [Panonychus citri]
MGYDVKRFSDLGFLAEDITCPICMSVFKDPVTTKCRHTYCRECISEWLARHQTCPLDKLVIDLYAGLTKPPIFVINILGRLMISCDYKEKGCQAIVKLEDLVEHVSSCPFSPKPVVSQMLINLTKFANHLKFPSLASWLNRVNQPRVNQSERPPTPPARFRIRSRLRHTELARQREQRDESEREEDLTSILFVFLIILLFALYLGILVRLTVEIFLIFLFEHISIVLFGILLVLIDFVPQPLSPNHQFDELLP